MENDLDFDIEGVWISRVEEAGAASLSGLMIHDLILTINDQKVGSVDEFKKLLVLISKNKLLEYSFCSSLTIVDVPSGELSSTTKISNVFF